MTDRLFIGTLGRVFIDTLGREYCVPWGADVVHQQVVQDNKLRVVSPVRSENRFLQLWCMRQDKDLVIVPLKSQIQREGLDPKMFFKDLETVLLAQIGDGSPIPSAGFMLVDGQYKPLRHYIPLKPMPDWPDWHFELAMRGMTLFEGVAAPGNDTNETNKKRAATKVTRIILGAAVDQKPAEGSELWLNPLVLSLRSGADIPGFDDNPGDVLLKQAVFRAVNEKQWMLVPRLSIEARRRLVGWQVFFADAGHSLLRALFCAEKPGQPKRPQLKPAPLQDLAALDDIGGTFHNRADGNSCWHWAPPADNGNVDAAELQFRDILLDSLGLMEEQDPSPDRIGWERSLPAGRDYQQLDITATSSLEKWLAGAVRLPHNSRALKAALDKLSSAVKELAQKLPADVEEIFSLLQTEGAFLVSDGKVFVSLYTALPTIATHYFKPRSDVAASLLGPRTSQDDQAQLLQKYPSHSIDLFAAAGGGWVETLQTVLDGDDAAAESVWGSRWETPFWRHCISGDQAKRFELTPASDGFRLDQSLLDGPDLLRGNAR